MSDRLFKVVAASTGVLTAFVAAEYFASYPGDLPLIEALDPFRQCLMQGSAPCDWVIGGVRLDFQERLLCVFVPLGAMVGHTFSRLNEVLNARTWRV